MRGLPDQFLASWAVKVGINDLQGTGTECMRRAAKRRSKALGLPASLSLSLSREADSSRNASVVPIRVGEGSISVCLTTNKWASKLLFFYRLSIDRKINVDRRIVGG